MKQYDTTAVFGKTFLRAVFRYVKKLMMDQFHQERERMPVERRVSVIKKVDYFSLWGTNNYEHSHSSNIKLSLVSKVVRFHSRFRIQTPLSKKSFNSELNVKKHIAYIID